MQNFEKRLNFQQLNYVETWVFDLDNTLYPARCNLFDQIDHRMTTFIAAQLELSRDKARRIQKKFYHAHGTSLRGLMIEYNLAPEPFLSFVHDIDTSKLVPAIELGQAMAKLPGQKIVYTNGSIKHAENVLSALQLTSHMDGLHGIDTSDYVPKPDPHGYHIMFKRHGINPNTTVMVEDSLKNLVTAKQLGMKTVLVEDMEGSQRASRMDTDAIANARTYVDIFIEDTAVWLIEVARQLDMAEDEG